MYKILALLLFLQSSTAMSKVYTFGLASDAGMKLPPAILLRDALKAEGIKKLIMNGDHLYRPKTDTYQSVWGSWSNFDFAVVSHGNHYSTYKEEQKFFKMPAEFYTKTFGKNIRFIVLNSDNEKNVGQQIKWYKKTLAAAKEKFVFVLLHHPPYTISSHHSRKEKEDFQLGFRPLTMKYKNKITAIITGHDHFAAVYRINDLTWIHSGASLQHNKAYTFDKKEVEPKITLKTVWYYDETFQFATLIIDDVKGVANINYYKTKTLKPTFKAELFPEFKVQSISAVSKPAINKKAKSKR